MGRASTPLPKKLIPLLPTIQSYVFNYIHKELAEILKSRRVFHNLGRQLMQLCVHLGSGTVDNKQTYSADPAVKRYNKQRH